MPVILCTGVLIGEYHESFSCDPSILPLSEVVIHSGVRRECVKADNRGDFEVYGIAGPSTTDGDLYEIMSSELNSDQERTACELRDLFEDSDCSVRDKDYVPDGSTSETSDEELNEGKF